jgi:hypothetical protein
MTRRWQYQIHAEGVGQGSLEGSGSVDTVEEIVQIANAPGQEDRDPCAVR